MPFPSIPAPSPEMDINGVINFLINLTRDLNWLLSELDTLNINQLDAKVINAGTISTDKLAAGAVTADKITVTSLSAISANLGTITAGTIIGALIKTALSGARIEMNGNKLSTYAANGNQRGIAWGDIFGPNYGDVGFFDDGFQTMLFECLGNQTGWQIKPDSGAPLYLGGTSQQTYGLGDWQMNGTFKIGAGSQFGTITQADSTATTLTQLVTDFNTLLANLQSLNILA